MSDQTIPPCPVCGKMPKLANQQLHLGIIIPRCVCITFAAIDSSMWQERCMYEMHNALHELGIETVEQLKAKVQPDPRVAVLEKKLAKLTDKLEMVEQESDQRLSAIISYSDQLLAMKEKYEPASQSDPHPDGCFSSYMNDVQDCETDGHYSCKDCKRNSRIAAQRGEEQI